METGPLSLRVTVINEYMYLYLIFCECCNLLRGPVGVVYSVIIEI